MRSNHEARGTAAKPNRDELLAAIQDMQLPEVKLMEVCGTHTMAIAKAGLKQMLRGQVKLLSGPGCPVCVTPAEEIDLFLDLAMRDDVLLTTYGDMLRVPGSVPGDTLWRRRGQGAKVQMVYSPMDALALARKRPERQIVFVGVGFETTAPGTAAAIAAAKAEELPNFTVLSLLKRVEPALRVLASDPELKVDGFLCPGHVATILGAESFRFLPAEYGAPAVVAGFEPEDILAAVYELCRQIKIGKPDLANEYGRAVSWTGNDLAVDMMNRVFEPVTAAWRGLGEMADSGLAIREAYADYDAAKRFGLEKRPAAPLNGCCCGEIIKGKMEPAKCPFFGKRCVPEDPVGPCMVSGEGACAAAYNHPEIL